MLLFNKVVIQLAILHELHDDVIIFAVVQQLQRPHNAVMRCSIHNFKFTSQ
jgi:hypothetical protein